jgi:GST-like protein
MDKQLAGHKFIAGNQYTVADIAIFPWANSWEKQGIDWADYPRLKVWFDAVAARPAVQRGLAVLAGARKPLTDENARRALFGSSQYQKR